MSMLGGSATVTCHTDGTDTVAGTGLALALATARMASRITQFTAMATLAGGALDARTFATYQAIGNQVASDATADGDAIVTYVTANAVVTTPTSGIVGTASGVTTGAGVSGPLVCTGSIVGAVT